MYGKANPVVSTAHDRRLTVLGEVTTPADLGALIKQLRTQQGVTQQALAAFAGTGQRFIVDLERGKTTVQFNRVLSVLDRLGTKLAVIAR
ncbi:type II toxin-antitoxin system Y4mF family antitoxin [Cupriavidus sp. amp6]|uniref:type II toxin-antitoxin system Y4mF family antitoxin n=1 Tax=Cupriavidus sp. amp6 TaxID=388051 RepID=UPI000407E488|nr:type II toxin-antitoxin system Y4mF family antitoxin [Cupriavidus sp. amp6]